ncbi:MAG: hypothetical protein LBG27_05155 [Spirochaetaceae bacterium]|nr:hypothetical protein [Spirochaetaceae bacterium]
MENREQFKKIDRKLAEYAKEAAEQTKEVRQIMADVGRKQVENAGQLRKLDEKVGRVCGNAGGLNRSLGGLIETLIATRLWEKFPNYDLKRACQRIPLDYEKRQVRTDVDILLADTIVCMAVEAKLELTGETVSLVPPSERFELKTW